MALRVNVQGGTGAGTRRPLTTLPSSWRCDCGHDNQGNHARCMRRGCNRRRPKL